MPKWTDIDPNFTERLQWEWTDKGFSFKQVRDWVNVGLNPQEANFAYWLEREGYTALEVLDFGEVEELKKDYEEYLINPPKKSVNIPHFNYTKLLIVLAIFVIITYYLLK